MARRARRTGNVFYGCSKYPRCSYTTNFEPVGANHDVDGGPVARKADGSGLCLRCGAPVELPDPVVVGASLAGGAPDPEAIATKARRSSSGGSRGRAAASSSSATRPRRTRTSKSAA